METVQQNGRFTLFSSKFLSIYIYILFSMYTYYFPLVTKSLIKPFKDFMYYVRQKTYLTLGWLCYVRSFWSSLQYLSFWVTMYM